MRELSKKRLDRTFRCNLQLSWPSVNIMLSSEYKSVALTDSHSKANAVKVQFFRIVLILLAVNKPDG